MSRRRFSRCCTRTNRCPCNSLGPPWDVTIVSVRELGRWPKKRASDLRVDAESGRCGLLSRFPITEKGGENGDLGVADGRVVLVEWRIRN